MFLHFIATGKLELLGILVLSRWRNISLFAFVVLTLFKLPDPGVGIYVQSLLKFPTVWDAQGRSKSPPHPVSPPLGHNIDSCITTVTETPKGRGYLTHVWAPYRGAPEGLKS